jgi:hypothetical protein
LVAQINAGTITNNLAPTYTIISGTPTVAVTAGNLIISIILAVNLPVIPAENIAAPINAVANGNISVTGVSTVTGLVIDALRNISDTTGVVATAYNMGSGRQNATIVLTVLPASGKRFDTTANFYTTGAGANNLSTGLNGKLTGATVSNSVESFYTILNGAPAVTVNNGNLIITITLRLPYVDAGPIVAAINSAANGNITVASATSVTGPIVSALAGTGTVTTVYNTTRTRAIAITLAPPIGQAFDSAVGAYSTVGDAVNSKLGAAPTITNSVQAEYNLLKGIPTVAATGGNLVITINLTKVLSDVTAAAVVSAINGAANGDLVFTFDWGTFATTVDGAVLTALSVFGEPVGAYDFVSTLTITITPAKDENRFIPTANAYSTAASALTTKLASGSITNWDGSALRAGTVTVAVTNENLVFTVPVAAP